MELFNNDKEMQDAFKIIENTNRNIHIIGGAGSGKSYFIKKEKLLIL